MQPKSAETLAHLVVKLRSNEYPTVKFDNNPSPATPPALVTKMLGKGKYANKKVGVFFTVEIAVELYSRGAKFVSVLTEFQCDVTQKITEAIGYKYMTIQEAKAQKVKFDVVLGNPPYLNGTWREFITQACSLSEHYVIMISPDGANSYSSRGKQIQTEMIESGIQSVTDVTSYFPTVTSGKIVCYEFNKQQPGQALAFSRTSIADSIFQKVTSFRATKLECQIGNQSKSFIDLPRHEKKQAGLITIVESLSVDKPPVFSFIESSKAKEFNANDYWFVTRFFGQAENSPVTGCNCKSAISHRIIAIKKISNESAIEFQKVYCSKIMRCVINTGKNGKFDTPTFILKQLPQINMSKKWTDKALYKHFGLTQEEIEYVETNFK